MAKLAKERQERFDGPVLPTNSSRGHNVTFSYVVDQE